MVWNAEIKHWSLGRPIVVIFGDSAIPNICVRNEQMNYQNDDTANVKMTVIFEAEIY